MRVAILADIHGNLEALQAVLGDMQGRGMDQVVCLGDNVGYGPNPEEVVQHLQQNGCQSVCGNHEFALFDERGRRWLNFQAAENCLATKQILSKESIDFLRTLPRNIQIDSGLFVHGFPLKSLFLYLNRQKVPRIRKLFGSYGIEVYFVGHTHRLEVVEKVPGNGEIRRWIPGEGVVQLGEGCQYIFGCGSVGQPRDGDGRAVYLVWDYADRYIAIVRVAYDFELTRRKIRERGFPEIYALRLG